MTANTATNKGIYLGKGIAPFPKLHAFATNENGSNKAFQSTLAGVVEISSSELKQKMQAQDEAKKSFFGMFPSISLD